MWVGEIQQHSNNEVTTQFYELLTVLLEYINLYSHFLQVSINKMEILTLKQLGLACLLKPNTCFWNPAISKFWCRHFPHVFLKFHIFQKKDAGGGPET